MLSPLNSNKQVPNSRIGFTIIESVIVILVMGILAFVVMPRAMNIWTNLRIGATEAEMGELMRAITGESDTGYEGFMDHMKRYPTALEGLDVLHTDPTGGGFNPMTKTGWLGPYISLLDSDNNGVYDVQEDPWGNAYHYSTSTSVQAAYTEHTLTIYSNGVDREDDSGGDDDIVIEHSYRVRNE